MPRLRQEANKRKTSVGHLRHLAFAAALWLPLSMAAAQGDRSSGDASRAVDNIRVRGVLHFDGRRFSDDVTPGTADTWLLRRVRPTIEGTVGGVYDFRITPDFAGGRTIILDAYVSTKLRPWAVLTAGKFKVPVGLERLQSASDLRFIERAFPTSLVPNRDLGVQLSGDVVGGAVSYAIGYFNGVSDGSSSDSNSPNADAENDTKGDWMARIFLRPFARSENPALNGLGFGIAGTYVDSTGTTDVTLLPSYRTPGQQVFFRYRGNSGAGGNATFADGERLRYSPQFYYYYGRLGVLGEYVNVSQDVTRVNNGVARSASLDNSAWHLQLSWLATGGKESYKAITPAHTTGSGALAWNAVELVARYHELRIDSEAFDGGADSFADPSTSARKASAAGVGVNWYLNRNAKLSFNYEKTRFDGGAAGGADREDEEAFLMRVALSF